MDSITIRISSYRKDRVTIGVFYTFVVWKLNVSSKRCRAVDGRKGKYSRMCVDTRAWRASRLSNFKIYVSTCSVTGASAGKQCEALPSYVSPRNICNVNGRILRIAENDIATIDGKISTNRNIVVCIHRDGTSTVRSFYDVTTYLNITTDGYVIACVHRDGISTVGGLNNITADF